MVRDPFSAEMKKGSLQLCVMALVAKRPMYGYEIISHLKKHSNGYFDIKEGTLYPILYRMVDKEIFKNEWLQVGEKPPRKYYTMTPKGQKALKKVHKEFDLMVSASNKILTDENLPLDDEAEKRPVKKKK